MAWPLDKPFDVNIAIFEGGRRFGRGGLQSGAGPWFRPPDAHPPAAPARGRFADPPETAFPPPFNSPFFRLEPFGAAGKNPRAPALHRAPRGDLLAHQLNHIRPWPDEFDVASLANLGEICRLSQKTIARMDGIDVEDFSGADDGRNV